MKKLVIFLTMIVPMAGCTAKTAQDVGIGMQIGGAGSTPLSPVVTVAGIITEIAGKIAEDRGQDERAPLSLEEIAARNKLIIDERAALMLKDKLRPKATTSDEEVKTSAKAICEELEGISAKYGYIKLSRKQMYQVLPSNALPEGDADEFQLPMPQNPYGGNCLAEMEMAGHRLVSLEPDL